MFKIKIIFFGTPPAEAMGKLLHSLLKPCSVVSLSVVRLFKKLFLPPNSEPILCNAFLELLSSFSARVFQKDSIAPYSPPPPCFINALSPHSQTPAKTLQDLCTALTTTHSLLPFKHDTQNLQESSR